MPTEKVVVIIDITKIMSTLEISREEAEQLLKDDKKVDKMTKMSEIDADLTENQRKVAKSMRITAKSTKNSPKTAKNRKIDDEKVEIVAKIAEIFGNCAEITNSEREIDLILGDNHYSITVTKHRKATK